MIEAKVVLDSISDAGARITTLQLKYPRFIHSEFLTHRVFSRNSSSSRAIPISKMIDQVRTDPAMPVEWGSNQPGMQAGEEVGDIDGAELAWRFAAQEAANRAETLNCLGLHKQIVNRILDPYQWMHTIVTATEWANFFKLRDHAAAQPEIAALARSMRTAMQLSAPTLRTEHLPYIKENEAQLPLATQHLISAARCARVSYLNHDGSNPDMQRDLELAIKLGQAGHMSPFEHQARAFDSVCTTSGNFRGWQQHRKWAEHG